MVEHGTPQAAFTTLVLQLYRAHNLAVAMDALAAIGARSFILAGAPARH
jgi:hypothetical protein